MNRERDGFVLKIRISFFPFSSIFSLVFVLSTYIYCFSLSHTHLLSLPPFPFPSLSESIGCAKPALWYETGFDGSVDLKLPSWLLLFQYPKISQSLDIFGIKKSKRTSRNGPTKKEFWTHKQTPNWFYIRITSKGNTHLYQGVPGRCGGRRKGGGWNSQEYTHLGTHFLRLYLDHVFARLTYFRPHYEGGRAKKKKKKKSEILNGPFWLWTRSFRF